MEASIIALPSLRQRHVVLSLSDQECFAVAAALRHDRNPWMPARDEAQDGAVIMALLPYHAQDNPDYVIGRTMGGFFLEDGFQRRMFTSLSDLLDSLTVSVQN